MVAELVCFVVVVLLLILLLIRRWCDGGGAAAGGKSTSTASHQALHPNISGKCKYTECDFPEYPDFLLLLFLLLIKRWCASHLSIPISRQVQIHIHKIYRI